MKIETASYEKSKKEIHFVRDTVFGEEQKVSRELDWDGRDSRCIHVLATDNENSIGTGRIQPDGRIGRLAVLKSWRGKGVGRKILELLLETADSDAIRRVYLHSQVQAIPFYEKCGFQKSGEEFTEGDIPHVKMVRPSRAPTGPGAQEGNREI